MALYDQFTTTPFDSLPVIPSDVFGVAVNYFVNRTPVLSRFPKAPVGSQNFKITNDQFRPRTVAMNNGGATTTSSTTITMADGSSFDAGDVIQIEAELMLVTSVAGNALTVTRAYAGTAGAIHADLLVATLITNTRNGAAVDIANMSRNPAVVNQWCQTVQHAYSVGGSLASTTNYVSGLGGPLERDKYLCMQHCFDDFESALYYGTIVGITAQQSAPMMGGFTALLQTNKTTAPTNASAYKSSDLVRDTMQKCYSNGGDPTILIVSTDFLGGLSLWGNTAQRVPAGENIFGTAIDLFEAPFLNGIKIIPAPLLKPGTAICLSGAEVRIRMKRPLIDQPRGKRGDATEGDMFMEGALEVDNESHHAFVTGITAFSGS